jgi:hypothetical protein
VDVQRLAGVNAGAAADQFSLDRRTDWAPDRAASWTDDPTDAGTMAWSAWVLVINPNRVAWLPLITSDPLVTVVLLVSRIGDAPWLGCRASRIGYARECR